jgi:beta-mannosidase
MKTHLNWRVGHSSSAHHTPTTFVPATVPGAVQLDWARAHGWPPAEYDTDLSKYAWMEDVYWVYQTQLHFELKTDQQLFFVCHGIDYEFEIRLNGVTLHKQTGMFTPVACALPSQTQNGDTLEVVVYPAPKSCATPVDRNQANQSCKPAVAYAWDFHPRLIPLGIWDEAFLEARPSVHLRDVVIDYTLADDDLQRATVHLHAPVGGLWGGCSVHWRIFDEDTVVLDTAAPAQDGAAHITSTIPIKLWWPNEQGAQQLYTSVVELRDGAGGVLERRQRKIGFRRVRLVMHPTQWQEREVQVFPKSRHTSPITLEINGRAIFAKGSNWVTPTLFPGTLTRERYREQLLLMRNAHMNIVRCWGGANVQKESFFELCDELGILVWQEFPLACNRYEGTPAYLAVLEQEAKSIINRIKTHPSLALWCGGNELFNNWSRMTDQDLALRLLNALCYLLDRDTPFLMTSPAMGMAHGGYFFRRPDGAEVFEYFVQAHNTAYTEFGVTAPASANTLRQIIPAHELWPPQPGTQWQVRHAFNAWEPNSWLDLPVIRDYFGEPRNLEELVHWGQWLQSEGYKAIFEEARRQKPKCSMALNWCLNEPWPTAANNSLVSWPNEPKPALAAVAQSLRPVLASARIPKFAWRAGETFACQLFLLNDAPEPAEAEIEASVHVGNAVLALGHWANARAGANQNAHGPTLQAVLPPADGGVLQLVLRVKARPEWSSEYTLRYLG